MKAELTTQRLRSHFQAITMTTLLQKGKIDLMVFATEYMPRIRQSKSELEQHLKDQISFLIASCKSYDEGHHVEARRIATSLRILLHDTWKSKSLLGQLRLRNILWIDTASRYDKDSLVSFVGLISVKFESGRIPRLVPRGLKDDEEIRKQEFNKWWSHPVIVAVTKPDKTFFSRQNLILNVANTDGGAHVDPDLEGEYIELSRKNSVGYSATVNGKKYPMLNPELPCLRQIAHEALLTLLEVDSNYFESPYDSQIKLIPYGKEIESDPSPEVGFEISVREH